MVVMMSKITLYYTPSADNVLNKTLTNGFEVQGSFKDEVDAMFPSISISEAVNFESYNYLYVPSLERYYYIEGYVKVSKGITNIQCRCDVLYTYKDLILSSIGELSGQTFISRTTLHNNVFTETGEIVVVTSGSENP